MKPCNSGTAANVSTSVLPARTRGQLAEAAELLVRRPEVQLVAVDILDDECRPTPFDAARPHLPLDEMPPQRLLLVVIEADEQTPMAGAGTGAVVNLVDDQLESEQAHLEDAVLRVPIEGEAEIFHIEAPRTLGVGDEEDSSSIQS